MRDVPHYIHVGVGPADLCNSDGLGGIICPRIHTFCPVESTGHVVQVCYEYIKPEILHLLKTKIDEDNKLQYLLLHRQGV